MKRFIALVLSLVMALSLCAPAWAEVASPTDLEGNGTAESPYLVDTADELAAALAAGGNVVLTNEVIISESLPVTKNTVLDLNGKNIGTDGSTTGSPLYLQGGKLTVKNGTLDLDGSHTNVNGTFSVAIGYDAQTELVVEDVSFTGKTAINGTFATDGPLKVTVSDCTMDVTSVGIAVSANSTDAIATINNCNIDADEYAIFASQGSKITINGGTYKSAGKVITSMYDNTVVTINGGTFDGELWVTDGGSLVIYGGTFSVNPAQWMDEDSTLTQNNDGTWTVTPDPVKVAQKALDNATVGTVIQLEAGVEYGTLYFRANPGHSNTTLEDIADAWAYNYNRSIEDVTILGATDAMVDGIIFETGALPGDCNNRVTVKNLVIDGVEFTDEFTASSAGYNAPVMITTSNATIDGLTVKNCKLVGDNEKLNLVYLYGADGSKNVTLTGNTVEGIARLCELRGTENVTITSNTIKNTYEHAMLLAGAGYSGNVTITGNTADGNNDRFLRMSGAAAASVVIEKNTITNYKGSDADIMKITDATGAVSITGNTVPTGKTATLDSVKGIVDITTNASCKIIGGTFTEKPADSYVADGYAVTETDGKYVVAVKKAETNKVETEVKVDVVAPSVEVPEVNTDGMTAEDKALVENVAATLENPGAVEFDNTALVAAAAEATTTVKNEVTAEEAADLLAEENIPVASDDKVNVVVQPYYDVKVESITVDEDGTASVAMNITPMYQTVVTTADVSNGESVVLPEDEGVTNAVAVGTPKEMTVTKPVTITIAIPAALAVADGDGFKPLYVTHEKDNGTKYVYEAEVKEVVGGYTATFTNPNGFSSFTLSTTNSAVAYVKDSDTSYATIESAISDAGKGAVIEVLVSDQVVNITAPCSFKLKLADNITEPTFNVAKGYTMSKWYVNGVYTYIVQSASAGGYAPSTTPEKVVTSADTFDAGIALYVGMSVMAAVGSAVVLKKRED